MTDKNVGKIPCPDCNGQGFYLKREGRGFYADGSFGHNQWADCDPCCGTGDARERLDYRYPKQMRERVARAIWEAGANASTTKWENASHDAKLIVYQKADAALSLMQPEIDRRVNAAIATMFERLRTPIWDALAAAYTTGATDVHNSWIAGTNGGEPDFGEAASDYAACVDPLTAFQQENSDATS